MMKKHLTFLLFLLLSIFTYGQEIIVRQILSIKEEKVSIYKPKILNGTQLYLKMSYGSSIISNPGEIKEIYGAKIASIEIVYSDYPSTDRFTSLTRKRIENLKKLYPPVFTDRNIVWKLVRQTDCSDKNSAQMLFHGIVITYRKTQSKSEIAKEITYLKDLSSKLPGSPTDGGYTYKIIKKGGDSLPESSRAEMVYTEDSTSKGVYPEFIDSTVLAVLNRHNWTNMVITADLTGSMSPYTAQLFVWLKLRTNTRRVKHFVFFNDGNLTPDDKKILGKTGGIYDTSSSEFKDIESLAYTTMQNGCGGDAPENDIEALIKAIGLCPTCSNIVLIADNWAPIKDISLLSEIKKPIKIILCGADMGINTNYLDLARATNGSVHTVEDDLTELMKLNEGQEITIRDQVYRLEKGKFLRISKI